MSHKKEGIVFLCLLLIPVLLERLGIISGNWHEDLRDVLLIFAAVAALIAANGIDDLKEQLKQMKPANDTNKFAGR